MIKIENVEVCGWKAAMRGMRNPLNSWEKSDTDFTTFDNPIIGPNDWKLMNNLVEAGTDHSKFMRMIIFSCDINAPLYWWKEMDTYKVGTVRNSCSTMHKIMDHEFTEEDFSFEHVREAYSIYTICELNYIRKEYLKTKDKNIWYELIQLLPSSYMQKATWTANYQVLRNVYHARKDHKLSEWHDFCRMIESLPHHELITGNLVTK